MTITIMLADAEGRTDLLAVHEGLPGRFADCSEAGIWK